ncbi:hypothetical protein [Rhodopirellula bahusiensis]|uniref:hypothetical protein n=1 Tax=Rhodopirellula bahusiensis TaxID=2014065 RepID=UPI003265B9A3
MNPDQILAGLLTFFARTPTTVPWNVVDLESDGLVVIVDTRDAACMLIMSAVAAEFGEVAALNSIGVDGIDVTGCLVRAGDRSREVTATLRGAYLFAMQEGTEHNDDHPF